MKWPIMLATAFTAVSVATLASMPASAGFCQSHRTVAVGKHPSIEADAKKTCYNKLKSKGFDIYGAQNGNPSSFMIECVELGGGGPSPAWKTYYQCICSGFCARKFRSIKTIPIWKSQNQNPIASQG
jgi:hypothetical protein